MRVVGLCAAFGACTGGQTGVPVSAKMDGSIGCQSSADAATALGIRGVDLQTMFEGSYSFSVPGSRLQGKNLTWLDPASFELTVTPTDEPVVGQDACAQVAAPVRVHLLGRELGLDASVLGLLTGTLQDATLSFGVQGGPANLDSHFMGAVFLHAGAEPYLILDTDAHTSWRSPTQETP